MHLAVRDYVTEHFTAEEAKRMLQVTREELALVPDVLGGLAECVGINPRDAKVLYNSARRACPAVLRILNRRISLKSEADMEEVRAHRPAFTRVFMIAKLGGVLDTVADARLFADLTRGRRSRYCVDVLCEFSLLRDNEEARQYTLAAADAFFDAANELPDFLSHFPAAHVSLDLFQQFSTVPGVTWRDVVGAADTVGETTTAAAALAALRYSKESRMSLARALSGSGSGGGRRGKVAAAVAATATQPPPPKRARKAAVGKVAAETMTYACAKCTTGAACDESSCTRVPSDPGVHFSCCTEMGHMCKPCTVKVAQKLLKDSIKRVACKDGTTLRHVDLRWTLFSFVDLATGERHVVNALGSSIVCDTLPSTKDVCAAAAKLFIRESAEGAGGAESTTAHLRLGASSPQTIWRVDPSSIVIERETRVREMVGVKFAAVFPGGDGVDGGVDPPPPTPCDATGPVFVCGALPGMVAKSTSVCLKAVVAAVQTTIENTDHEYNTRRIAREWDGAGQCAMTLSVGTTSHGRDVAVSDVVVVAQ